MGLFTLWYGFTAVVSWYVASELEKVKKYQLAGRWYFITLILYITFLYYKTKLGI